MMPETILIEREIGHEPYIEELSEYTHPDLKVDIFLRKMGLNVKKPKKPENTDSSLDKATADRYMNQITAAVNKQATAC